MNNAGRASSSSPCDPLSAPSELAARLVDWFTAPHYVVALSGGVDSAVVAMALSRSRRDGILVTAVGPSVSEADLADARHLAHQAQMPHVELATAESSDPAYQRNDIRRCYHCKSHLFQAIVDAYPGRLILTGTNADDLSDYRPGLQAADEYAVRTPLAELGIAKEQVRELAKLWGIDVADKPASPCLASRIAYGTEVTPKRLQMIEAAEAYLHSLGLGDLRVRLHEGQLARLEIAPEEIGHVMRPEVYGAIDRKLRELGFLFVTLDLQGLRSGSLNQLVPLELRNPT